MSESEDRDIEGRIARLEERDERLTRALELVAQQAAAPRKAGRDWDAYAAVIASFIGLLALAVSGYTAYVERKQLRAQVWPHLELWHSGSNPRYFATNRGTGPARVTAVRVMMDGAPVRTRSDVEKALGLSRENGFGWSSLGHAVLSPGQEFVFIEPKDSEASRERFKDLLPGGKHVLSLTACYCSVLDECWVAVLGKVRDVNALSDPCPISAGERLEE